MESATRFPRKSPNPTITKMYIASVAKDLAKELKMSRETVKAVIDLIPLFIAREIGKGKLVIFDNFGSFRPLLYTTNGKQNLTYRVKFKPSDTLRKMLRESALKNHPDMKEGNPPASPIPNSRKK